MTEYSSWYMPLQIPSLTHHSSPAFFTIIQDPVSKCTLKCSVSTYERKTLQITYAVGQTGGPPGKQCTGPPTLRSLPDLPRCGLVLPTVPLSPPSLTAPQPQTSSLPNPKVSPGPRSSLPHTLNRGLRQPHLPTIHTFP